MSLPLHDYVCSRCSLNCSADNWSGGVPIYSLGGGNVAPVRTRAAWCTTCATVTRAEALPSPQKVEEEILEAIEGSHRYAVDDDPFMRQIAALDARYVASSGTWRLWAADRQGSAERCLTCGSTVPALEVLEGGPEWPQRFVHPTCGGVVSLVEGDMRIDWCDTDLETIEFGRDGRRSALALSGG